MYSFVRTAALAGVVAWAAACRTSQAELKLAPVLDEVYGAELPPLYSARHVKEVLIERDLYYNGKLVYPRYLDEYFLLDARGRTVRREFAHNNHITYCHETTYNEQGRVAQFTYSQRQLNTPGPETGREGIVWLVAERTRYVASEADSTGKAHWDSQANRWQPETTELEYVAHDTTYTITRHRHIPRREVSRSYIANTRPLVLRTDYLTYSPKGLAEPRYYYQKYDEHGRLAEAGDVSFEQEVEKYIGAHPQEAAHYVFGGKNSLNPLLDQLARHSAGTLVPNYTYVYSPNGQLTQKTEYHARTGYERSPQGRLLKRDNGSEVTAYFYNPNGLLERAETTTRDGQPVETKFYRYVYR